MRPHPYATERYVGALSALEGGSAAWLKDWDCGVVARPIGGSLRDAAGVYPRTPLSPSARIAAGLAELRATGLVSLVVVPDPLTGPPPETLAAAFPLCRPFKTHFVIDRLCPDSISSGHRYRMRRAARRCQVSREPLAGVLDDWRRLYATLADRHGIAGPAAFSDAAFAALADDPAFDAFVARVDGRVAAMSIWFEHAGVAVYHLGASDAAGYRAGASYALFEAAFAHYGAERIDLGGAAGLADDPDDGLARFKRGFANAEVTAYLCGAILDAAAYARLCADLPATAYFPAYRASAPAPSGRRLIASKRSASTPITTTST